MKSSMPSGTGQLYRKLATDVAALGLPASPPAPPVTEDDLAALPAAAARYLNFMGVSGRPPDSSFLGHFARLFHMRITAAAVLPMTGRDAYVHGRGWMHGVALAGGDRPGPGRHVQL